MTKRKKILLASLLSIVTFGSVAAFSGGQHCFNPEKRAAFMVKRMTHKLDLNETQVTHLKAVQQLMSQHHKAKKEQGRGELLSLLDAPELDQNQALSLLENRTEQIKQNAPEMIAAIADFTNSLSAEQRTELKQVVKNFPNRGGFGKHFNAE
jgi:Spy/CpxP family protein refolding chaperone